MVCTPATIFGPFEQTMFLGSSIMSFSASQGWNDQASEVTVQLVTDNCAGNKFYWDGDLNKQSWAIADPGFVGLTTPIIGAPAYFRVGDFEYSGLIQSWEETNSESEAPVYQVKLVDPRAILENCQIIINEYAGGVGSTYNLINAFGFSETFGSVLCPEIFQSAPGLYVPGNGSIDGTVFGSPAAGSLAAGCRLRAGQPQSPGRQARAAA